MNELYITTNIDKICIYAKQKADELKLDLYIIEGTKDGLTKLVELAKTHIKAVILILNITKSPIFDVLLPILEETDLHIILVSDKYDLKQAFISRCNVKWLETNCKEEINTFIKKKICPTEISIEFLCALSDYLIKYYTKYTYNKLLYINNLIKDISLSTNNILQDELKDRLKEIFR